MIMIMRLYTWPDDYEEWCREAETQVDRASDVTGEEQEVILMMNSWSFNQKEIVPHHIAVFSLSLSEDALLPEPMLCTSLQLFISENLET